MGSSTILLMTEYVQILHAMAKATRELGEYRVAVDLNGQRLILMDLVEDKVVSVLKVRPE